MTFVLCLECEIVTLEWTVVVFIQEKLKVFEVQSLMQTSFPVLVFFLQFYKYRITHTSIALSACNVIIVLVERPDDLLSILTKLLFNKVNISGAIYVIHFQYISVIPWL